MVHRFEWRPVDRALLETLLESARHAPSGGHSQGLSMSWPVPYWYVDGRYFGGTHDQVPRVCAEFGIPSEQQLIGILGLGYRAADDVKLGSSVTIPRRAVDDVLHWERW